MVEARFGPRPAPGFIHVLALAAAFIAPPAAVAQSYPGRPVRLIVSLAPGGGTDFVARVLAGKLSEAWSQQVVVDNRPGAGSIVGAEIVAKAAPDGYTLLMGTNSLLTQPSLFKNLPYNVTRDFAPVTLALRAPLLLSAHPSLAASNLKELIALAQARPGELTYASPALATTGHLGGELFKQIARVNILHVPYKGAGSAISNLLAGEISLMYSSPPAVIMHIRAGKLKALGVTGSKRAAQAPDIPTFDESGLTGVEAYDWYGILTPAGTPKPIIDALNAQIVRILQMPDVSDRFASTQFAEPVGSTPDELQRFMRSEIERWARVIRQANIRAE